MIIAKFEAKVLTQVVFRTEFLVDQKLPPVNQWTSRKVDGKKVKFFLARRQVKEKTSESELLKLLLIFPVTAATS